MVSLVVLTPTTEKNGGTAVLSGSHRWLGAYLKKQAKPLDPADLLCAAHPTTTARLFAREPHVHWFDRPRLRALVWPPPL